MADSDPLAPFANPLPRHRFTVQDVWAMQKAGALDEDANLELIDGELVPMNAKHHPHEVVKRSLVEELVVRSQRRFAVGVEQTLYLSDTLYFEPDILVSARNIRTTDLRGPDVLLLIEIADTSQVRDLQVKAPRYAAHGVRDYWVVDVEAQQTTVHRRPAPEGYAEIIRHPAEAELAALLLDLGSFIIPWER
jgi:Uma2 family endonuclease